MKRKFKIANIVLLTFLAISSGITKIMLLPINKMRVWGAGIIAVTL